MNEVSGSTLQNERKSAPAVIYCRTAHVSQATEQDVSSQEARCREYARSKNYDVVQVFHDEGVSGTRMDRPGMQKVLDFVSSVRDQHPIVLIGDISRLARNWSVHIQLREAIEAAGATLECPSFEFRDTPESRLAENLFAAREQLPEQIEDES